MRGPLLFWNRLHGRCAAVVALAVLIAGQCVPSAAQPAGSMALPRLSHKVPTSAGETDTKLEYSWSPKEPAVYKYSIRVDIAGQKLAYRGRNTLRLSARKPVLAAPEHSEQEGTGSGFVVHPEGIVITCAHVVRGATKLTARVGERDYAATLIGADYDQDIAVLRLRAKDLPYVVFADSDQVRLADEVRALGFPLTDLLGESIKVTRGEVSGIGGTNNSLQIDASPNPGSSGGPIVDSSARVIGVASALLSGARVSEVGFAVPSNPVMEFLKSLHVPVAVSEASTAMAAADVVEQVSPACVFIQATYGPNGIGSGDLVEVDYSSYWYDATIPTPGARLPRRTLPESGRGQMVVSPSGDVLDGGGEPSLPCLLGGGGLVGIERIPSTAPGTASSSSPLVLQRMEPDRQSQQFSPYGLRPSYRSRLGMTWAREPEPRINIQLLAGLESTEYKFAAYQGDRIKLTKTYELEIEGPSKDEQPYLKMTGKGTGEFNQKTGLMLSMDFQAQLVVTEGNVSVRVPVRMQYELMTAEQLAEEARQAAEREKQRERLATEQRQAESRGTSFSISSKPQDSSGPQPKSIKSLQPSAKLNKFDPDN